MLQPYPPGQFRQMCLGLGYRDWGGCRHSHSLNLSRHWSVFQPARLLGTALARISLADQDAHHDHGFVNPRVSTSLFTYIITTVFLPHGLLPSFGIIWVFIVIVVIDIAIFGPRSSQLRVEEIAQ